VADDLRDTVHQALHVPCPVHRMRDCSPLLNGCTWPSTLNAQADAVVELIGALRAERDRLARALDEAQLRSIEASNPGIDMDEVRRLRSQVDEAKADPRTPATDESSVLPESQEHTDG